MKEEELIKMEAQIDLYRTSEIPVVYRRDVDLIKESLIKYATENDLSVPVFKDDFDIHKDLDVAHESIGGFLRGIKDIIADLISKLFGGSSGGGGGGGGGSDKSPKDVKANKSETERVKTNAKKIIVKKIEEKERELIQKTNDPVEKDNIKRESKDVKRQALLDLDAKAPIHPKKYDHYPDIKIPRKAANDILNIFVNQFDILLDVYYGQHDVDIEDRIKVKSDFYWNERVKIFNETFNTSFEKQFGNIFEYVKGQKFDYTLSKNNVWNKLSYDHHLRNEGFYKKDFIVIGVVNNDMYYVSYDERMKFHKGKFETDGVIGRMDFTYKLDISLKALYDIRDIIENATMYDVYYVDKIRKHVKSKIDEGDTNDGTKLRLLQTLELVDDISLTMVKMKKQNLEILNKCIKMYLDAIGTGEWLNDGDRETLRLNFENDNVNPIDMY